MATIRELWARLASSFGQPTAKVGADDSDAAYRLLAENSVDVVFRFSAGGRPHYISPSAEKLYGCAPEEIIKAASEPGPNRFVHPDDAPMVANAIARHFSGEIDELRADFRILRIDGTPVWVETNCRTVKDAKTGAVTDIIFSMRDISEKKALEAELASLARTDALTNLANRRAFDETLDREWRRTMREGNELSLLILDIDHFKRFNDANGHQVGDDCLRTVATVINGAARRPGDLSARYGGEEFAVILPSTGREDAIQIAKTICRSVEALALPHPDNAASNFVTISIGVATAVAMQGGTMRMPDGLIQSADRALYRAKGSGRNRVESSLLLTPFADTGTSG